MTPRALTPGDLSSIEPVSGGRGLVIDQPASSTDTPQPSATTLATDLMKHAINMGTGGNSEDMGDGNNEGRGREAGVGEQVHLDSKTTSPPPVTQSPTELTDSEDTVSPKPTPAPLSPITPSRNLVEPTSALAAAPTTLSTVEEQAPSRQEKGEVNAAVEEGYPSPASVLLPPQATPTDPSATKKEEEVLSRIDERISRNKTLKPLKVDTTTSPSSAPHLNENPDNNKDSDNQSHHRLPTPTSPALPPRPNSRPPSRPPSVSRSRRPSHYRTLSSSSATSTAIRPPTSPLLLDSSSSSSKRLSATSNHSASTTAAVPPGSPRLIDGAGVELDSSMNNNKIPPSPLSGPSRRASQFEVDTLSSANLPPSPPPDSETIEEPETIQHQEEEEEEEEVEPWNVKVTIRDWAYPPSDPRHLGLIHPDLDPKNPKNRKKKKKGRLGGVRKRLAGSGGGSKREKAKGGIRSFLGSFTRPGEESSSEEEEDDDGDDDDDEEDGEEEEEDDEDEEREEDERRRNGLGLGSPVDGTLGNGSFSWGFVTSHSTDFPASSPASSSTGDPPSGYTFHDGDYDGLSSQPFYSSSSLARLSSNGDRTARGDSEESELHYSIEEQEEMERQRQMEIERELGLGEFVPGIYQAVYEFVPELETEMKLDVGEWVSVFERQCAGWVQAGRIVDGVLTDEVGLVPENYLQRFEADTEETGNTSISTSEGTKVEGGVGEIDGQKKDLESESTKDGHSWSRVEGQEQPSKVEATD